jgi:hypothetical protein
MSEFSLSSDVPSGEGAIRPTGESRLRLARLPVPRSRPIPGPLKKSGGKTRHDKYGEVVQPVTRASSAEAPYQACGTRPGRAPPTAIDHSGGRLIDDEHRCNSTRYMR